MYYDLPVYQDLYRLILLLFQYTKEFPREYKYSLGQEIRRDGVVLVRSMYRANRSYEKRQHLEVFLDDFEVLKLEIRLCIDLHLISMKQQSRISLLMEGIGKQIIGWRNAAQ